MSRASLQIAFVAVLASRAHAQPTDPKAAAKLHEQTGTHFFDVQQYDKAAEEYQQAYLLDPQPPYLYASAQAQRLSGDCTKALRSYRAYLRTNPSASDEEKTRKNIDRCEQDLRDHPPAPDLHVVIPTTIVPAIPVPVAPPPPPPPHASWTGDRLGHGLVIGGLAVAATGVVLFVGGRSTISDNNAAPTYGDFASGRADAASAHTKEVIGVSAMALGGALIAGGIMHYVVHAGRPAPQLSAAVIPGQASLFFTRSF